MKYLGASLDLQNVKLENLAEGTASADGVTFSQLKAVENGKFWKDAARVVITSNVNIAGGGIANGTTHDGETLATGERVLLTGQTTASQNGLYVVPASGGASRAADMATGVAAAGFWFTVTEGTTYHDTRWYVASDKDADTVGTHALTITQDTAGLTYTADESTITLTGSEFSVADGGIDTLQLADDAVTEAKILNGAVTSSKLSDGATTEAKIGTGAVTEAKIGTGAVTTSKIADDSITEDKLHPDVVAQLGASLDDGSVTTLKLADDAVTAAKIADGAVETAAIANEAVTAAKIADGAIDDGAKIADNIISTAKLVDGSVTADKIGIGAVTDAKLATKPNKTYTTVIGNGSLTELPVTHNLGTRAVTVQVYDTSTGADVLVDIVRTSTTVVTLTFASAPSTGAYTVVVQGRSD